MTNTNDRAEAALDLAQRINAAMESGEVPTKTTLLTWYGIALNAAGMDYCDECGDEYEQYHDEPHPDDDSGICQPCAEKQRQEWDRSNRLNCAGTPFRY